MNSPSTAYTPLEAFALFQELNRNFQNGIVIGTFGRISDALKRTPLICEQGDYDVTRLSPESLQGYALQILKEERKREAEAAAANRHNASLSPNSRKRKIESPPLPTIQEALEQKDKLPNLVEKLYLQFREGLIKDIRADERRFEEIQRELAEIQRGEWDDRHRQGQHADHGKNGVSSTKDTIPAAPATAAIPEAQVAPPSVPTTISTTVPASVPAPTPMPTPTPTPITTSIPVSTLPPVPIPSRIHDSGRKVEPPRTPQPLQKNAHQVPSPLPPTARPASEARNATPDNRPHESARPISSTTQVLQHPQVTQGYIPRPGSVPPHPPVTDGLQQPVGIPKGRSPTPIQSLQSNQPHTPSPAPALKWEPPYQPPHQPLHQTLHQPSHQSAHQLPHQPHQPSHQLSPQPSHPPPHQSPPPPSQHQTPHQTPVPSPRPPYGSGVARPPIYPAQPSAGQPHFPQNYTGGRQTPGQYAQQPRPAVQGSAPASPSVLLPPQNAGQIPPSLQSLPLNATPDGAGQQSQQRRPASIPVSNSPGLNAGPTLHSQHPSQHVPDPPPVQPPAALSNTHPTAGPAKPPVPPTQWSQTPGPVRPSYSPQTPVQATPAPQQNQPQVSSRSYNSPYHLQAQPASGHEPAQRPQVPPLQTPGPVAQSTRPSLITQAQTPVTGSPHIIRGHATKWVSTPTPATPRMENLSGYFDIESPVFEPLSPPPQPAQLPKASSPDNARKKELQKATPKLDGSASRPRGRPRTVHKPVPQTQVEEKETPVEPDLAVSNIKNEVATPQGLDQIGDPATADESVPGQIHTGLSQVSNKRKRQDSPLNRAPPTPATHVLWTRSFNKISQSALDQIISHRHANMFAHPVKPKTAPGYFEIVLRPQDLKGIQKAITAGSKAAAAAVATMTDTDPSATNVWLPISIDLVPPRGIVNIAQLERELVHMFANAIMYNPDPYRGFGPSFLKSNQRASMDGDGEDYRGYEVDENGVVKDTRSMFGEVEKLLGDLRNEVERNAPPLTGVPPSMSRSMSAVAFEASTAEDDADEQTGEANKRRRVRG
ncbi:hypothetical protein GGR53DRAFT_486348 [Hypoxylon sp. FL1150]|nr:hypothetical protein GGR53DRAFT_486348 [Hypoxylon sp. FL1150]